MSAVGEVRCLNGLQLFGKTSVVVYTVFRDIIVRGIFGKNKGVQEREFMLRGYKHVFVSIL